MKMTLLKLSEKIKEATGRDFFDEDVCNDILDIDVRVGSVSYDFGDFYVEFDIEDIDCENLTSDKNVVEVKEVQTPQKKVVVDKEDGEWGRVIISHIPEFDWYELDIDGEPLQCFETFEEVKGNIPL